MLIWKIIILLTMVTYGRPKKDEVLQLKQPQHFKEIIVLEHREAELRYLTSLYGIVDANINEKAFLESALELRKYRGIGNKIAHFPVTAKSESQISESSNIVKCNRVFNILQKELKGLYKYKKMENKQMNYKKKVVLDFKRIETKRDYTFEEYFTFECNGEKEDKSGNEIAIYLSEIEESETGNANRFTFVFKSLEDDKVKVLAIINNQKLRQKIHHINYHDKDETFMEYEISHDVLIPLKLLAEIQLKVSTGEDKNGKKKKLNITKNKEEPASITIIKNPYQSDVTDGDEHYVEETNMVGFTTDDSKKILKKAEPIRYKRIDKLNSSLPHDLVETELAEFIYFTSFYNFVYTAKSKEDRRTIQKYLDLLEDAMEIQNTNRRVSEYSFTISLFKEDPVLQQATCAAASLYLQLLTSWSSFFLKDDTKQDAITLQKMIIRFTDENFLEFNGTIKQTVVKCPPLAVNVRNDIYFNVLHFRENDVEKEFTFIYDDAVEEEIVDKEVRYKKIEGEISVLFFVNNDNLQYKNALETIVSNITRGYIEV